MRIDYFINGKKNEPKQAPLLDRVANFTVEVLRPRRVVLEDGTVFEYTVAGNELKRHALRATGYVIKKLTEASVEKKAVVTFNRIADDSVFLTDEELRSLGYTDAEIEEIKKEYNIVDA